MKAGKSICRWALAAWVTALSFQFSQAGSSANSSISVTVKDSGEPLADAIVRIVPLEQSAEAKTKRHAGMTDDKGKFPFFFSTPVVVHISHLGFTSITDTFYAPQQKSYALSYVSQEVKDVVITGQYAPNSVQKSVYEVKVVTADMLRAKGATNLREALQNELHIDLGQDQVFGSTMSINGISGEGVKIMVDGVPIVGRLDGKLDLSQINVNNIERIEMVEGPLSVMFGTDAMGGVINIITKSFQRQKLNVEAKGYYETVGQYNVELNTGFAFKKNQLFISGGRNFFDGYTIHDSLPRVQDWKPKEQYFADAKYLYSGNKLTASLAGSFFRELMLSRSAPRKTFLYTEEGTSWTYVGDDVKYLTYRPRATLTLGYNFKKDYHLNVLAAYSGFMRFTNKYSKNLVDGSEQLVNDPAVQDTARYHQVLVRTTYSMSVWKERISFQAGLETNQEITRQTYLKNNKQQASDYAAFGSVRFSVVEGLDIQPAMRVVYNTRFKVPVIPSLNIKYGYKDKFVLRASYGRGYRAPSIKELFMFFFDGSDHAIKGNEALVPESGHSVNASFNGYVKHRKHDLQFTLSGFYNNINNKIDFAMFSAPFPPDTYQYFNLKKYITYGGSAGITYSWDRLNVNVSALITRYELSNKGDQTDKVKTYSPDFTASVGYTIPKAEIGVNVYYKYDGIKPLYSVSNSIQAGTRGAYHSLDISLSRSFWKDRIQVVVGGKNLVGITSVQTKGVAAVGHDFSPNATNIGWGRTFFTSLALRFSK